LYTVPSIANEFVRNRKQHDAIAKQWTELYAKPNKGKQKEVLQIDDDSDADTLVQTSRKRKKKSTPQSNNSSKRRIDDVIVIDD